MGRIEPIRVTHDAVACAYRARRCSNVTSAGASPFTEPRVRAAYHRDDPEGVDESRVALFCPPCAAAVHGLLPYFPATYIRAEDVRGLLAGALANDQVSESPEELLGRPHVVSGYRASFAAPAHLGQ